MKRLNVLFLVLGFVLLTGCGKDDPSPGQSARMSLNDNKCLLLREYSERWGNGKKLSKEYFYDSNRRLIKRQTNIDYTLYTYDPTGLTVTLKHYRLPDSTMYGYDVQEYDARGLLTKTSIYKPHDSSSPILLWETQTMEYDQNNKIVKKKIQPAIGPNDPFTTILYTHLPNQEIREDYHTPPGDSARIFQTILWRFDDKKAPATLDFENSWNGNRNPMMYNYTYSSYNSVTNYTHQYNVHGYPVTTVESNGNSADDTTIWYEYDCL